MRERGLRERDERRLVRHREQREAEPVGLPGDGGRDRVEPEPEPDPEPGEAVRREAADVRALRQPAAAEPEPRREQELAALEPVRRVGELGDVHPAHVVVEPGRSTRDGELEAGQGGDLADGQHTWSLPSDWTGGPERMACERFRQLPTRQRVECRGGVSGALAGRRMLRDESSVPRRHPKGDTMITVPFRGRRSRAARCAGAAACAAALLGLVAVDDARANGVPCISPASKAYSLTLSALTGPAGASLALAVTPAPGCDAVGVLKKVELELVAPDGSKDTRKFTHETAPNGVVELAIGQVARGTTIAANVLVQSGTPERTYVVRADATAKLRPDLVVEQVAPQQTLVGKPVVITAVVVERNGDVGATGVVSLSALPGATQPVVVPAGGRATVTFAPATFASAVPVELTVKVDGAAPTETDTTNNERMSTLDVTEHQLPTPHTVLFPSLVGYGPQFNNHLYAPITPWPVGEGYGEHRSEGQAARAADRADLLQRQLGRERERTVPGLADELRLVRPGREARAGERER